MHVDVAFGNSIGSCGGGNSSSGSGNISMASDFLAVVVGSLRCACSFNCVML